MTTQPQAKRKAASYAYPTPATGARCATCGKRFHRTGAFDAHRIGKYEARGYGGRLLAHSTRRCLTDSEMAKAGYVLSADGFYTRPTKIPAFGIREPQ